MSNSGTFRSDFSSKEFPLIDKVSEKYISNYLSNEIEVLSDLQIKIN
jgi:hypothetical protein